MKREDLEKLTIPQVSDLLAEKTLRLLEAMEKNTDGIILRDMKNEVELIKEIIQKRRPN
jgi:hypothetical protein